MRRRWREGKRYLPSRRRTALGIVAIVFSLLALALGFYSEFQDFGDHSAVRSVVMCIQERRRISTLPPSVRDRFFRTTGFDEDDIARLDIAIERVAGLHEAVNEFHQRALEGKTNLTGANFLGSPEGRAWRKLRWALDEVNHHLRNGSLKEARQNLEERLAPLLDAIELPAEAETDNRAVR